MSIPSKADCKKALEHYEYYTTDTGKTIKDLLTAYLSGDIGECASEDELWAVFQNGRGCKKTGEDCNFRGCHSWAECKLLIEALLSRLPKREEVSEEKLAEFLYDYFREAGIGDTWEIAKHNVYIFEEWMGNACAIKHYIEKGE